jgi:chloramphenicol 3-O-phosphotransferase
MWFCPVTDKGDPTVEFDNGRACLLLTGPPGAGKSSVASALAQRLQRCALLDGDAINRLIVSGFVWALGEPAHEAARQVRLLHANLCALAANFADAEITPLIDAVIADRERLDFFLQTLAPRRVLLVVLTPTAEVCRSRNEGRPPESQFFFDGHEALMAAMREEFGTIGWWFDTSDRSLDETVQQVTSVAHILAETRP